MRAERRQQRLSLPRLKRLLPILLFAIVATWLTFAVGAASLFRNARPDAALKVAPFDARARARAAEQIVQGSANDRRRLGAAEALSLAALRRDPTIVQAWRTLALVAVLRRQPNRAGRLFHLVERMSRRDLPTELWLIEENVNRNDVAGALLHYDVALRTSLSSHELLLPIILRALNDPNLVEPMARLLVTDPPWKEQFFGALIQQPPSGANLARLMEMIAARGQLSSTDLLSGLVAYYGDRREFGAAWRIYQVLKNAPRAQPGTLRNGGFEGPNRVPPFDWRLESATEMGAEPRPVPAPGAGTGLYAYAATGTTGVVARQLLLLGPGGYTLGALGGLTAAARPERMTWKIACASTPATALTAQSALPSGSAGGPVQARFQVPASGCEAQWLLLEIAAGSSEGNAEAWVDSVRISPS
jgi:hypothetical protein